jgi:hypothetical protein
LHAATLYSGNADTDGKVSRPGLYDFKMVSLAQMRKPFLKKGLISTVSWKRAGIGKRRAAKAALKVKQGEKSDQFTAWKTV